jgi:hypothetical protein
VTATLERLLTESGYGFVHAADMRAQLAACGSLADWSQFSASWDDLEIDQYRAEGSRDRRRRYAVYAIDRDGTIAREAHQPHYQRAQYNVLYGGIERWFAPIADGAGRSSTLATVLRFCDRTFRPIAPPAVDAWHVEVHQFRIEARADAPGQPTPEGVHRDGVDFVLVLLVNRVNISSGTTTVYDLAGRTLGSFTLTEPLDAALVDDRRVAHGVTPVAPIDPSRPAYRDVLVVTFRKTAQV